MYRLEQPVVDTLKVQFAPLRTAHWPNRRASLPAQVEVVTAPVERPYLKHDQGAQLLQVMATWEAHSPQQPPDALCGWALRYHNGKPQAHLLHRADRAPSSTPCRPAVLRDAQEESPWRRAALHDLRTPELAQAYLRDFWCVEHHGEGQLVTSCDDIEWFTPLTAAERHSLEVEISPLCGERSSSRGGDSALRPLTIDRDGNEYRIQAHVLRDSNLHLLEFLLVTYGEPTTFHGFRHRSELIPLTKEGALSLRISGLPSNWRPRPQRWVGQFWRMLRPEERKRWHEVDVYEARLVLADANRHLRPHLRTHSPPSGQPAVVHRKHIPCYDLHLIEMQQCYGGAPPHPKSPGSAAEGASYRVCILWTHGFAHPIDGQLTTLRRLHRSLSEHNDWAIDTHDQAAAFVHFLFEMIWGANGRSELVTSDCGPVAHRLQEHAATVESETTVSEVIERLRPIAFKTRHRPDGQFHFETEVHIFDGGHLKRLQLGVWPDGDIAVKAPQETVLTLARPGSISTPDPPLPATWVLRTTAAPITALPDGQRPVMDASVLAPTLGGPTPRGKAQRIANTVIVGELRLEDTDLSCGIVFSRCRFRGLLYLSSLKVRGNVNFENCVFENGVELKRNYISGNLRFFNCTVLGGPIVLNETLASLIVLFGTSSEAGLLGRRVRAGELRLLDVVLDGEVNLVRANVSGQIEIAGRRKQRPDPWPPQQPIPPLDSWSFIGGKLNLTGVRADSVHLHYATIEGPMDFDSSIIQKYISIAFTRILDNLVLHNTVVKYGYAWLTDVDVRKNLFARYLRVKTTFYLDAIGSRPSHIGGSLVLSRATIPKLLRVRHAHIDGALEARGLQASSVSIGGGRALGDYTGAWEETRKCDPDGWHSGELTRIGETIELSHAAIAHNLEVVGVSGRHGRALVRVLARAPAKADLRLYGSTSANGPFSLTPKGGSAPNAPCQRGCQTLSRTRVWRKSLIRMRKAQVKGDIVFYLQEKTARRRCLIPSEASVPEGLRLVMPGGIDLSKARVGGDIVASHVVCSAGFLNFNDVNVGHHLCLETQAVSARRARLPPARAMGLLMNGIECGGTTDISGLCLSPSEPQLRARHVREREMAGRSRMRTPRDAVPELDLAHPLLNMADRFIEYEHRGCVIARHATFRHRLVVTDPDLFKESRSGAWRRPSATIPGSLDLTESSIGTFVLSTDSFNYRGDPAVYGVVLRKAQLEKMKILLPNPSTGRNLPSDYPSPIDLRYAQIQWWEFMVPRQAQGRYMDTSVSDDARHHIGFLNDDQQVHLHCWQAVEDSFRRAGNDSEADKVHIAMNEWAQKRRARDKRQQPVTRRAMDFSMHFPWRVLDRLLDRLSYGGQPAATALAISMLLWLAASAAIFCNPANVGPSELYLAQERTPPADDAHPEEWDTFDALFLALRYHLPLATFTARSQWDPHDNGNRTDVSHLEPALPFKSLPVNPERYCNIVLLIHWILVPLALVIFSRTKLRRA